jgi:hypothetical protein
MLVSQYIANYRMHLIVSIHKQNNHQQVASKEPGQAWCGQPIRPLMLDVDHMIVANKSLMEENRRVNAERLDVDRVMGGC